LMGLFVSCTNQDTSPELSTSEFKILTSVKEIQKGSKN